MQGVAAAMGPPCNAVSIKNHIAKLRAMAREQKLGGNSSDPGSASGSNATATPTKKGGTQKTKTYGKAKGGAKKSAAAAKKAAGGDSDDENGSNNDATPDKKVVKGAKKGRVSNKRKNDAVTDEYVTPKFSLFREPNC